jgi:hypothetical protein
LRDKRTEIAVFHKQKCPKPARHEKDAQQSLDDQKAAKQTKPPFRIFG